MQLPSMQIKDGREIFLIHKFLRSRIVINW